MLVENADVLPKLVTRKLAPIARRNGRGTLCETTKPARPEMEGRRTERDDARDPLLSPGAGGRWSSWPGGSVKGRGEEPWLRSERGMFVSRNGVLCYRDCFSECKLLFRSQTKDLLT